MFAAKEKRMAPSPVDQPAHFFQPRLRAESPSPNANKPEANYAAGALIQMKEKETPKKQSCDTGRALHWGCDTTCLLYGFKDSDTPFTDEKGEYGRSSCCNKWPPSVEYYSRQYLNLNGAASCRPEHKKKIATVKHGEKEVRVACMDTIPRDSTQLIELSPKAAIDLYGKYQNANVEVCYTGVIEDENLCYVETPTPRYPRITQCLEKNCIPQDPFTETCEFYGWPNG
ncbi:MAG: hypothetical protein HUU01_21315 [Saprospiraceae bacterium]|nr:hypothetical protein [Saprospiraceae bacterium]